VVPGKEPKVKYERDPFYNEELGYTIDEVYESITATIAEHVKEFKTSQFLYKDDY
jgi:hypothetical protein